MSHFTVLVVGNEPEKKLAPFKEYDGETDFPREWLTFKNIEAEYRKEYEENEEKEVGVSTDGGWFFLWDNRYRSPKYTFSLHTKSEEYLPPSFLGDRVEKRTIQQLYPTFENYMHKYCEYEYHKGYGWGYWVNPNGKWDWYSLGGRWTGFFKLKKGKRGIVGEQGLMTPHPKSGYADQAKKGDIDWEGMGLEAMYKGQADKKLFDELTKGHPPITTWEEFEEQGLEREAIRELFWSQPAIRAVKNTERFSWVEYGEILDLLKPDFPERMKRRSVCTFAIITEDGRWLERGGMGWFGAVHDEKDKDEWARGFSAMLEQLPDHTLLSVYDCHI